MTQFHRGAVSDKTVVAIIQAKLTKDVAELFNSVYGTMLIALRQYYSFHENLGGAVRRNTMQQVPLRLMQRAVRPLGESADPFADEGWRHEPDGGPRFRALTGHYKILAKPELAWRVAAERLQIAKDEANRWTI